MTMLQQIAAAARQLEVASSIRTAIGAALTPEQQLAISAKIEHGPEAFISWSRTEDGREALRTLADKFAAS